MICDKWRYEIAKYIINGDNMMEDYTKSVDLTGFKWAEWDCIPFLIDNIKERQYKIR